MIGVFANCKTSRIISVLQSSAGFESGVLLAFAPCQRVIQFIHHPNEHNTIFTHAFSHQIQIPLQPPERSQHLYFKEQSCYLLSPEARGEMRDLYRDTG